MLRALSAIAMLLPTLAYAQNAAPELLSVDGRNSSVTFHMVHKLHKFQGTSKSVEGKARLLPNGQAQVAIRVPVASFDTENVNRDEHMKETVEAAKYPTVELKAIVAEATFPSVFPSSVETKAKCQLLFHGVTQSLEIPLKLMFESASKVVVTASFSVSLDAFKVERPSLIFVKVDDNMKVDASLVLEK